MLMRKADMCWGGKLKARYMGKYNKTNKIDQAT